MSLKDPEARRAYNKSYHLKNRAHILAKKNAYRQEHHQVIVAKQRDSYYANQEKNQEKAREYREKHLLASQQRAREYHQQYREEISAKKKAYREAHKERIRLKKQQDYERDRQRILLQKKIYHQEHSAKIQAYQKHYRHENPERVNAFSQRRRARKSGAPVNDFTAAQWREMQEAWDHRCAYCGKRAKGRLAREHIRPLSKGGSNTLSNIVPACRLCNSKKHVGPPLQPVQPLLLTLALPKKTRKT